MAVFSQDGDAAFFFEVVAVHHAFIYVLVGAEGAGLAQELVYECGFAMIDVGDDGDVTNVFHVSLLPQRVRKIILETVHYSSPTIRPAKPGRWSDVFQLAFGV